MSAVVQTEAAGAPEVSFVIPCLNEEEGVGAVVEGARERLAAAGASAEVIVVDNGSEDRSVERAEAAGARVVHESRRGYGSAYLAGMAAARGDYVFMADADGTYDLERVPEMVERLRNGAELVMGSRFKGGIERGAMPWTNRYIGNPILTGMLNLFFRTGVSDAHCGLRAIRRDAIPRLKLSATGMEFASEMVIKAAKRRLRIEEVPIRYRPRIGDSKLNRFRDAWRHVRFMLVHSPTWLFVVPGGLAAVAGLGTAAVLAFSGGDGPAPTAIALAAGILALLGAQLVLLGVYARTYAVVYLGEEEPALVGAWRRFRLEHGLGLGAAVAAVGLAVALVSHFNARSDPRLGFLGLTLLALGVQGIFGAFFLSILGLSEHAVLRRRHQR